MPIARLTELAYDKTQCGGFAPGYKGRETGLVRHENGPIEAIYPLFCKQNK